MGLRFSKRDLCVVLLLVSSLFLDACGKQPPGVIHRIGGGFPPPALNPYWAVSSWVVDEANSTGCANDGNNCQSTTCAAGGVGPCRTPEAITSGRWGCIGDQKGCPRLRQATTWTDLSSTSGNNHPRYFRPACEQGGYLILKAALPTPLESPPGTLPNQAVNAVRSSATLQRLNWGNANGFPTPVAGMFVVDTTHSANAWVHDQVITSTFHPTTIMAAATLPSATTNLADFNTTANTVWQTGDTVHVYQPLFSVDIVAVEGVSADSPSAFPCVVMNQLRISDPAGSGVDAVQWGPDVIGYEIQVDRRIQLMNGTGEFHDVGCVNCYITSGLIGQRGSTGSYWRMNGGTFTSAATAINPGGAGVAFDADAWFTANAVLNAGAALGLVYLDNTVVLKVNGNTTLAELANGYTALSLWGPGTINVVASGRLGVDLSVNTTFANTIFTSLQLNSQTAGCAVNSSIPATWNCGISVTTGHLDTSFAGGGFGGTALSELGPATISSTIQ